MGKVEPLLVGRAYEYRSLVVHEHFKMIYRVDDACDIIYIIDFRDVRQEPQTLTNRGRDVAMHPSSRGRGCGSQWPRRCV